MQLTTKAKIVEKIKTDYDFGDNKGTSYKVRILVDVDIFEIKFKANDNTIYDQLPEKGDCDLLLNITSPKEVIRLEILEVRTK
jgi:hypothetical protein